MVSLVDFVGVWPQPSPTWDNDGQRSKALFLAHKSVATGRHRISVRSGGE